MSAGSGTTPLRPIVTDRASRGFFAAAAAGDLAVLTCEACGARVHLPRPLCTDCGARKLNWQSVAQTGRVYSWTVVEHQVHPAFPVPYTVILVDVDGEQSVRMVGRLEGRATVQVGTPVRVEFERLGEDPDGEAVVLPQWVLIDDGNES